MPGYETAVVRLVTDAGATAGLGVLVRRNAVVTCAHVVNTALGRPQREQATPTVPVLLEFPLTKGGAVRRATLASWAAPAPAGAGGGDVACLVLGEDAPPTATPARFSTEPGTPGEVLRVFGYPGTPPRSDGAWVDLDFKGEVGKQLIQVESRGDQTIKAQAGYSGSPVWSDQTGLVVGLLHATAFADEPERDAYLIPPSAVAEAWQSADHAPWGRGAVPVVLGLIVLSALPLTLARMLAFESSYPKTFDEFAESTVPWTLAVVVPLVLAALLALPGRPSTALSLGFGLVFGAYLVLTETSAYWAALFVEFSDRYVPGPALWSLFLGWAVVTGAVVVILARSDLAGSAGIRTDWRILCALVALGSVVVAITSVSEARTPWVWIMFHAGLVILGLAAFPVCLLRLRGDQAVAGLVAVTVLAYWLVSFLARDYVQQRSGIAPSVRMTEIVCVVVTVLACVAAQAGPALRPAATASVHR